MRPKDFFTSLEEKQKLAAEAPVKEKGEERQRIDAVAEEIKEKIKIKNN